MSGTVIFGYRHVTNVPLCPCRDPGDYCTFEQPTSDPLDCLLRCWCGSTMRVTFKDLAERQAFLAEQGVTGD